MHVQCRTTTRAQNPFSRWACPARPPAPTPGMTFWRPHPRRRSRRIKPTPPPRPTPANPLHRPPPPPPPPILLNRINRILTTRGMKPTKPPQKSPHRHPVKQNEGKQKTIQISPFLPPSLRPFL